MGDPEQTKDTTHMKAGGPTVFPGQAVTLSNQQPSPPSYLAQAPPPSLAVQPAQPYAQPQVVMTTQGHVIQMAPQPVQVAAQQPTQVIICAGDLGDVPTTTMCRNCGQRVQTRVVYHSGAFTWLICGLCILFGLVFGCCVIPFFMDVCKDAHHFCPNCNVNLCIHKKL